MTTSPNSVFAVRFAHPNAFGTSQTRETLYAIQKIFFLTKNDNRLSKTDKFDFFFIYRGG